MPQKSLKPTLRAWLPVMYETEPLISVVPVRIWSLAAMPVSLVFERPR